MFTDQDLQQIQARGSALAVIEQQVEHFRTGFPFMDIVKAATVGEGIIRLADEEIERLVAAYEAKLPHLKVIKFVPASGAASRMFKALFAFMDSYDQTAEAQAAFESEKGPVYDFFARLTDFAFYDELSSTFEGKDLKTLLAEKDYATVLAHLLKEPGLGYGSLPKGLLKFHGYTDEVRTPLEEHLVEAANYATVTGGTAYLHFTVSPEHQSKFETLLELVKFRYEEMFGVTLEVSFSIQKPATDTIAVTPDMDPFRFDNGSILFRPGGHGALIENLNDLEADIIFIKNVDNVVPDRIKDETYRYKKALAGLLGEMQDRVFEYESKLMADDSAGLIAEVLSFLEQELCVLPATDLRTQGEAEQKAYALEMLRRPIRICGMVKNEGEPGGGPFWTKNSIGTTSLQIVESAKIDKSNPNQMAIMQHATHFNPVDLVIATKDKEGEAYDLLNHRDPSTGFIANKSKNGRELLAQELPGLWNGAMANWNTLFVEVPIVTFNPVKTVNDLLRPNHQPA